MIQFPKIQARFDAALAVIEGATVGGGDPEETQNLKAALASAQKSAKSAAETAAAAETATKAAQQDAEAAKEEANKVSTTLKTAQERVKALETALAQKEKELAEKADKDGGIEAERAAMATQVDALEKAHSESDEKLDKALQYNKHLKMLNDNLRKENELNVANPELINKSLEAELAQLKEQRDMDLETVNGILAQLTPLVEGA